MNGRVLIVDDDQSFCEMLAADLRDVGYDPEWVTSSKDGLDRALGEEFDAVITVDPHLHRTHDLADAVPAVNAIALSATEAMREFLLQLERYAGAILLGYPVISDVTTTPPGIPGRAGPHPGLSRRRPGPAVDPPTADLVRRSPGAALRSGCRWPVPGRPRARTRPATPCRSATTSAKPESYRATISVVAPSAPI